MHLQSINNHTGIWGTHTQRTGQARLLDTLTESELIDIVGSCHVHQREISIAQCCNCAPTPSGATSNLFEKLL